MRERPGDREHLLETVSLRRSEDARPFTKLEKKISVPPTCCSFSEVIPVHFFSPEEQDREEEIRRD